jgi:NADP-dependent 3-hydroxy acid dehydrogenase YdfG
MSMMREGVAIITGGGTGIGAATALELAGAGMRVAVVGRRPEPLGEVVAGIAARGGEAVSHPADVDDYAAMARVVAEVGARWGRIDVVVSNAALHDVSSVASGDPAWWRQVVETNVLGGMSIVRAALPEMYRRESGHIVIVASVSGRVTYVGEPVYVASKHALVAFGECLRQEVSPRGLRVTLVEPGLVETPFIDNPFARELKKTVTPLQPEDCARVIRFAVEQPPHCAINEVVLRPVKQVL